MWNIVTRGFTCAALFPLVAFLAYCACRDVARAVRASNWSDAFHTLAAFALFAIIWGTTLKMLIEAVRAYCKLRKEAPRGFPVILHPPPEKPDDGNSEPRSPD